MPATAQEICHLLNSMLVRDPAATYSLVINRVPCNRAMVDHPLVVVDAADAAGDHSLVGLLGVLNGLCFTGPGCDIVAGEFDDKTAELKQFRVVKRRGWKPDDVI